MTGWPALSNTLRFNGRWLGIDNLPRTPDSSAALRIFFSSGVKTVY